MVFDGPADSNPSRGFFFNNATLINGTESTSYYLLSVTIVALGSNNNTEVTCFVPQQDYFPKIIQDMFFIIASKLTLAINFS